jgi:hypothetical protein
MVAADDLDRSVIGINLMRVQFGSPDWDAVVRSLGDGLWEPHQQPACAMLNCHAEMGI